MVTELKILNLAFRPLSDQQDEENPDVDLNENEDLDDDDDEDDAASPAEEEAVEPVDTGEEQ